METKQKDRSGSTDKFQKRQEIRYMGADEWIEEHGSGTLRKNKRIGFAWHTQYMQERIAYEFGYYFECVPRTRITFNDPITEGDCHPITEAGWHIERYQNLSVFEEDKFEAKYISVEYRDGTRREGVGMVVTETSFSVSSGNIIFVIIAEYDVVNKQYKPAINPF